MTTEELTTLILNKLSLEYNTVLRKARSNTCEILAGDMILAILEQGTVPKAAKLLNRGAQTLNRILDEYFVPKFGKLNGGNETWKWKLLTFIEYKSCTSCKEIKPFKEFDIDNNASCGRHHYCKSCRKELNKIAYSKDHTKEAHKRSYEKNYTKILERSQHYKGERSLRCVSWEDTKALQDFYKDCPEGMHVDHILPLKGELVSGLHVVANLQYLTPEENIAKGNRIDLEEYNLKHYGT